MYAKELWSRHDVNCNKNFQMPSKVFNPVEVRSIHDQTTNTNPLVLIMHVAGFAPWMRSC